MIFIIIDFPSLRLLVTIFLASPLTYIYIFDTLYIYFYISVYPVATKAMNYFVDR